VSAIVRRRRGDDDSGIVDAMAESASPGHGSGWQLLDDRLAARPMRITDGEDGHPLPNMSAIVLRHEPVAELDDELIISD